jgi:hypothetical protein
VRWLLAAVILAGQASACGGLQPAGGTEVPRRLNPALLHVPVLAGEDTELSVKTLAAKLDGEPAQVVAVRGPSDELLLVLIMDVSQELGLVDRAKPALGAAIQQLSPKTSVALMRSQDGLQVLLDPTTDRQAILDAVTALAVSGRAGLLDTVETAVRIADTVLAKAAVRVAVVYLTDSDIYNYREDYINPVINSSDPHDMSRRFPEGLVREKISRLEAKLAVFQAPLFVIHLAYRSDRLNEAYQAGVMQLAAAAGGASVFCRTQAEIPEAIAGMFRTVSRHYSVVLHWPPRPARIVPVQLDSGGRTLVYRNRFVFSQ